MEPQASPPVHLSCQGLPVRLTPEPSAIASILLGRVRGCARPIPAQGCHLLAESGLAETGPLKRLGVVCTGLVRLSLGRKRI